MSLKHMRDHAAEAANRVPQDVREQHPTIPWAAVIGMRNRLVHGYDDVDLNIVWGVLTKELPPLLAELEKIVQLEDGEDGESSPPMP